MAHRYFQTVAGADDVRAGEATQFKWELVKDRVRCVVSFPVDQWWSPVGAIGDLALGVVFLYFWFCSRTLIVFWMM